MKTLNYKIVLLLILSSLVNITAIAAPDTLKILFIGNSYTFTNDMPALLRKAALSRGIHIKTGQHAKGGWTFANHWNSEFTKEMIKKGGWDYIVLQEYSQNPALPYEKFKNTVLSYSGKLEQLCKEYNPDAEIVFYMTWGRKNGDLKNCPANPQVCTYLGMDGLIRQRYMMMAENKALVSPVGAVWRFLRKTHPKIELYIADGSHPSLAGSYASALSFFTVVTRKDPTKVKFNSKLDGNTASIIKRIVKKVVYDSLSYWNVGKFDPKAKFTVSKYEHNGYEFINESVNSSEYQWDFGDGTTSTLRNPKHTYYKLGKYNVKLIAKKKHFLDSSEQKVEINQTENLSSSSVKKDKKGVNKNRKE
ncbi:MAG: PKD domain-containing protein [Bacteroidota bacterium]|nr:PKD domain-containing protein [Bacteroidota bacterium]